MYTTLRHNYIAKIPKTWVFQVATNGSEAWTLERTALTKTNVFYSKLWEIAKNSLHRNTKKKSTRRASSVRTLACKLCKETKGETFWPPEMTRRARGRLNKKKRINGGQKKEEGRRQKEKKTYRNCLDSELKCNFHIISHGQSSHLITPSFFYITYELYSALFHLSVACGLQTYFGCRFSPFENFERERSDYRKYVCSSKANLFANMTFTDRHR